MSGRLYASCAKFMERIFFLLHGLGSTLARRRDQDTVNQIHYWSISILDYSSLLKSSLSTPPTHGGRRSVCTSQCSNKSFQQDTGITELLKSRSGSILILSSPSTLTLRKILKICCENTRVSLYVSPVGNCNLIRN